MFSNTTITSVAFVMASSLVMLVAMLVAGRRSRLDVRLRGLSGDEATSSDPVAVSQIALTTLPKMGRVLVPSDEGERSRLATRLVQAGLYGRQAMPIFLGVKMLMVVAPLLIGLAAGFAGLVETQIGLLFGGCLGMVGIIGPSFWLDSQKKTRQVAFRRALPDALDVLVICLEGGLSLPGSLRRVTEELRTAHPALATEMGIVEREIQLGRTAGEGLRQMAERTDLEEIRSLASVIIQADRFGASLTKSLRVHAETLRTKRQQRAEEMAQKASIKLLFPTILFIFPAVFVVILGPAAIHLIRIFAGMGM
jgi:tight adherence protein C